MSAYIDITIGEEKIRYKTTYRIARSINVLLNNHWEAKEDKDGAPNFKFESEKDRSDFVLAIREAVTQALEAGNEKK